MTPPTTGISGGELWSPALAPLLHCAFDGMAIWAPNPWRICRANPAFWKLLGAAHPIGESIVRVSDLPEETAEHLANVLRQFIESGRDTGTLNPSSVPGTHGQWVAIRLCRIGSADEPAIGMIVHLTGESSAERGSADTSRIDPLTGLPDRSVLLTHLASLLEGDRARDRRFALLFLDLDNFKQVNDQFGHLVGDMVLRRAGRRIAECVRERDMVARYGGDEFVALIDGATAMTDVQPVVERIRASLNRPVELAEGGVRLSLAAGVAFATEACDSPEELLRMADRAMYAAKRSAAVVKSRER